MSQLEPYRRTIKITQFQLFGIASFLIIRLKRKIGKINNQNYNMFCFLHDFFNVYILILLNVWIIIWWQNGFFQWPQFQYNYQKYCKTSAYLGTVFFPLILATYDIVQIINTYQWFRSRDQFQFNYQLILVPFVLSLPAGYLIFFQDQYNVIRSYFPLQCQIFPQGEETSVVYIASEWAQYFYFNLPGWVINFMLLILTIKVFSEMKRNSDTYKQIYQLFRKGVFIITFIYTLNNIIKNLFISNIFQHSPYFPQIMMCLQVFLFITNFIEFICYNYFFWGEFTFRELILGYQTEVKIPIIWVEANNSGKRPFIEDNDSNNFLS